MIEGSPPTHNSFMSAINAGFHPRSGSYELNDIELYVFKK